MQISDKALAGLLGAAKEIGVDIDVEEIDEGTNKCENKYIEGEIVSDNSTSIDTSFNFVDEIPND